MAATTPRTAPPANWDDEISHDEEDAVLGTQAGAPAKGWQTTPSSQQRGPMSAAATSGSARNRMSEQRNIPPQVEGIPGKETRRTEAAKADHDRRTPGVLGASSGGSGLTPQSTWDKWFPNRSKMGQEGIDNPPPTGTPPQQVTQLHPPSVAGAISPRATGHETAADYASIAAKDNSIYSGHEPTTVTRGGPPAEPDVNSPEIQGALNAAAGSSATPDNGAVTTSPAQAQLIADRYGPKATLPLGMQTPPTAGAAPAAGVPPLTDPRRFRMDNAPMGAAKGMGFNASLHNPSEEDGETKPDDEQNENNMPATPKIADRVIHQPFR